MTFTVVISPKAVRQLKRLENFRRERIVSAIALLAENPFPSGCVSLRGTEGFRIRVGSFRVLYTVQSEVRRVEILKVERRETVYDNL